LHDSQNGVLQKSGANAATSKTHINSQTSDHHNRHRIRHISTDAARCMCVRNGARRQSVVADDPPADTDDISARCSALFVLERTTHKPLIERRLATLKFRKIVSGR
jgi:hypothetical protein